MLSAFRRAARRAPTFVRKPSSSKEKRYVGKFLSVSSYPHANSLRDVLFLMLIMIRGFIVSSSLCGVLTLRRVYVPSVECQVVC